MRALSSILALLVCAPLFAACGDGGACPPGSTAVGGRCVVPGSDAGSPEQGTDAGPCGGSCGAATVCEPHTGRCVGCLTAADCAAPTPACDTLTFSCVPCMADSDCAAPTPACDTATHTCVPCIDDSACTDPAAPFCDSTHVCGGCLNSVDCARFDGTATCDRTSGACVECTATDTAACDGGVCDASTHTCSVPTPGSAGLCQPCVSDAQCQAGQLCIPMTFGASATSVGNFCLWRQDATGTYAPNGDCTAAPPYAKIIADATSVDGTTATVCGLQLTTCPALHDWRNKRCSGPGTGDAECGADGLDDGFCVVAGSLTNLCTIPCAADDDCPGIPGIAVFHCDRTTWLCGVN